MAVVELRDFSKGVNSLDSPGSVPPGYLPVALNATGRGKAVVQRFGTTKRGSPAATAKFIYHSPIFSTTLFVQEGAALKTYTLGPFMSGSPTTIKTFTTAGKIAACDFISGSGSDRVVVFVHPVDGVFTWDGTTFSSELTSGAVQGDTIAVWQNKVWVGGDSANQTRVWWSNAGRADVWTTSEDFVDIREINDEQITALGIGNGMDATGRGGLNVFKRSSAYVIIDSETGEYVTIDAYRGAENHEAVTSGAGGIYCANNIGIYRVTDQGLDEIHEAVKPVWDDPSIGFRHTTAWAFSDRLYFSADAYIYEYVPSEKAWWVHSLNKDGTETGVISATSTSDATSGQSQPRPYLLDDDGGVVLDMWDDPLGHAYVSGIECDDYAEGDTAGGGPYAVTCTIRLPWLGNGLDEFRVDRCLVRGFGGGASGVTVTPTILSNFAATGTARATFALGGSSISEDDATINQLGVHRAMQLQLVASGDTSEQLPPPDPGSSIPIQSPAFGITAVRFDVVDLRE